MGPGVALVDSAESVAAEASEWLHRHPALAAPPGEGSAGHHFYVTDAPAPFVAVAERFLGRAIRRLERARIEGE